MLTTPEAPMNIQTPLEMPMKARRMTALALAAANAPTPQRIARGDVVPFELDRGTIKPARVEDPLDRYLSRGEIHVSLFNLAREYGLLRWRAGLVPNAKANPMMDRVDGGGDGATAPIEDKVDALSRLVRTDAAVAKLSGRRRAAKRHLGVLAAVCAEGQSAARWAWDNGHRRNGQGMAILKDALRVLAKVWGRA